MVGQDYEDRKADEVYQELQQEVHQNRAKEKSWIFNLDNKVKIGMVVVVLVTLYYATKGKLSFLQATGIIGVVALIIYLFFQQAEGPRKLTEKECAISLYQKLRDMQKNPLGSYYRLARGKVIVGFIGKERWLEGKPWKREIAFTIKLDNGLEKQYSSEINVWDGDIIGVRDRTGGYSGGESRDVDIIASKALRDEKAQQKYMKTG
jgi:hypothetical protein